jgi:2,3-bisphosphoglycerate-dependent phosphoglycerate mutase
MRHVSKLVLVRHGESEFNASVRQSRVAGEGFAWDGARQADIQLTAKGVTQAQTAGKQLATHPMFHRVIISPYLRTVQTAQHIVQQLSYPAELRFDDRVREREKGMIEGLSDQKFEQLHPEEFKRSRYEGEFYYRPAGGESYPDVRLRVHSFLTSMRTHFPGKSILVVTHAITIWAFRSLLERLGESELLDLKADPEHKIGNCSILEYQIDELGRRLVAASARV